MRIYLLGMMGSGKSTVGKKLANKLSCNFYDLDDLIENKIGTSISDYFEKKGEKSFRLIEQEMLRKTFVLDHAVISTGGGTPCFFSNMEEMNKHGLSCYLKADVGLLLSRLKGAIEQRPLLGKLGSEEKIKNYLTQLLEQREFFYKQACETVAAIDANAEKIINALGLKR